MELRAKNKEEIVVKVQTWHGETWGNQDIGNSNDEGDRKKGKSWSRSISWKKGYNYGKILHFIRDRPKSNN